MKLLKSDFSKVHAVVMTAALVNLLMGIALTLPKVNYEVVSDIHVFSGLLLLPLILLLPACFRNRKRLYAALRARLFITRRDWAHKKPLTLLAKATTMLMALGFVILLLTVFLLKTGLAYTLIPSLDLFTFHTRFVYVMPALMALHILLMWLSTRVHHTPAQPSPETSAADRAA